MSKKLKIWKKALLCGAAALFTSNVYAQSQIIAPFKNGDRVAFVGNSITDGGHYHSYIWLYYMTHFPDMRITCYNVGIGGDVAKQIARRFDDDVLRRNPTVVTLTWGMNDTGYFEWFYPNAEQTFKTRLDTSIKYYHEIEGKLLNRRNIRPIIIASSPYDEFTYATPNNIYRGKSAALLKVAEFQEQAARKNNWDFVDFNRPMTEINKREQVKNPTFSLTPNDRIHPDNDGHMVMAYLFLKDQGLTNKPVADVEVDAANKKVLKADNCKITRLNANAGDISFDYLAKSLPYPLDTVSHGWGNKKRQAEAVKIVPIMQELDREVLTVKNLQAGNYNLLIDGEKIGVWPADQFAKGINLAEQTGTPQYQQAMQIMQMNEERWELERRLRNHAFIEYNVLMQRGLLHADNRAAMDTVNLLARKDPFVAGNKPTYTLSQYKTVREAWQQEQNVLLDEIYRINKPVSHKITISRIN
ncbi:SGNH/GDSL hydrolase family protein [Mucilaginibacter sp. 21P]|uniref:SGNH/GDSL hydrolase family protein n=1 Tax=Mucilaginibacter sp. 21P TaxID=2778902 RepID=UPI001C590C79|nr:SGNH/GDSL hydrolase family protein [Mucilaginibacter sp. 21P]QXV65269.1 SGNH/GDSL hydrolase family protein [Mucilaginibacter sp. 21P]